jgi:hypothetical protein
MKRSFLVILLFLLCIACGVKNDPEYRSQNKNNKIIQLV